MLKPIGRFSFHDLWRCVVLGYAGNNILPFRLGEIVRAMAFKLLTGAPSSTGLASVLAERLLDGLTLVTIFGLMLLGIAAPETNSLLRPIYWGGVILAVGGIGILGGSLVMADPLVALAHRVSPRLGHLSARLAEAVAFLRSPPTCLVVLALSLGVWMIEGSMFVLLAWSLELPSPFTVGFLSLAVVNLGILLPAAPGYIGVFQIAAVAAFSVLGLPKSEGLAFGLLVHSAQFFPLTLLGLVVAAPMWTGLVRLVKRPANTPA